MAKPTKQERMAHAKKTEKSETPPCPVCGGPSIYVHFYAHSGKRQFCLWCEKCQGGFKAGG